MPSIDHYQSTAQLTNGVESWGSPMALDAKQLWDWMPVEVFLQTVGTTKDITNRLELSAIGKRLSECYIAVQLGQMQTWYRSDVDGPFALVLCMSRRVSQHCAPAACNLSCSAYPPCYFCGTCVAAQDTV